MQVHDEVEQIASLAEMGSITDATERLIKLSRDLGMSATTLEEKRLSDLLAYYGEKVRQQGEVAPVFPSEEFLVADVAENLIETEIKKIEAEFWSNVDQIKSYFNDLRLLTINNGVLTRADKVMRNWDCTLQEENITGEELRKSGTKLTALLNDYYKEPHSVLRQYKSPSISGTPKVGKKQAYADLMEKSSEIVRKVEELPSLLGRYRALEDTEQQRRWENRRSIVWYRSLGLAIRGALNDSPFTFDPFHRPMTGVNSLPSP